ncbi:hypothetical protein E4U57_000329 [Claviceps arundinis]|uniref:ARS-binding protein 1 N-terminal domain-containing protein n=1 Tax=Claviceps arundinis TaxID=1623583 RepID=A0A9P7MN64_9HYPO|nr:hypothetical protein E4U57_000329 [Claviceps arundinis]KAG5961307.1 hypothetical protein E4U56_003933 [Claviceps arundinis]
MAPTTPKSPVKKSKRIRITNGQRLALRKHHKQFPHKKQTQLAEWFRDQFNNRPSPGTISESLSDKYKHLEDLTKPLHESATRVLRGQ